MRKIFLLLGCLICFAAFNFFEAISFSSGAPVGHAGSPLSNGANCTSCHSDFGVNTGSANVQFKLLGVDAYEPGETYTLQVSAIETGKTRYGFEATSYSPRDDANIGTLQLIDAQRTQLRSTTSGDATFATHTSGGIDVGSDTAKWQVDWIAPAAGSGTVEFYAAVNVTNRSFGTDGDYIYTRSISVPEAEATSIEPPSFLATARVYPNPTSDLLRVSFTPPQTTNVHLQLIDAQGRLVYDLRDMAWPGNFSAEIPVRAFAGGLYTLYLETDAGTAQYPIMVKR